MHDPMGPMPHHENRTLVQRIYAAQASPNGPLVNCTTCTCSAYDAEHRMGDGLCTEELFRCTCSCSVSAHVDDADSGRCRTCPCTRYARRER